MEPVDTILFCNFKLAFRIFELVLKKNKEII